jgi:hypothetical protein
MATDGGGSRVEQRLTAILGKWINYAKRCGALYPEGSRFRAEWEIRAACYYRVLRLVNKLF